MTTVSLPNTMVAGEAASASEVQGNDEALRDAMNLALDGDNLSSATSVQLGLSSSTVVRRGAIMTATTETRNNTAYGTLTTADQVANVVVGTNGLLRVYFQATWQESVVNAARAAIFIGANQLKMVPGSTVSTAPAVQEAQIFAASSVANRDTPLSTSSEGMVSCGNSAGAYTGDVTTGQIIGVRTGSTTSSLNLMGACTIFVAAGTYTISVQFKASSGTVTAKNRRLYVETWGP